MRYRTPILLILGFLMAGFRYPQQTDGWVYEREKQGIKIFTKKGDWSKLRDSRAIMQVSSTPEQVLSVITDFDSYPAWMAHCKQARVIARLNENEFIAYMLIGVPWPLKDRDCVMRVKIARDGKSGAITLTETSEPKYIKEQDGVVRIKQLISTWRFTPKNGGTEVTNEYASNPGGDIPDWITNTQSVETPLNTFEKLQQKVVTRK